MNKNPKILLFLLVFLSSFAPLHSDSDAIDSVIYWGEERAFLQKDNLYIQFEMDNNRASRGYPKELNKTSWPGVTFPAIDAAFDFGNGKIFLFHKNQYISYDKKKNRADFGFPKTINAITWPGITFDGIDAAFNAGNGKVYFFRSSQYIRYDLKNERADRGYPKPINQSTWPGLSFKTLDAAMGYGNKAYFFSGSEYIRFDIPRDRADSGYPKKIIRNWKGVDFSSGSAATTMIKPQSPGPNIKPETPITSNTSTSTASGSGFTIQTTTVDLSPHTIHLENTVLGWIMTESLNSGDVMIAYQSKNDVHLQKLNSSYKKVGNPIILRGYWFSDMLALNDGSLIVLLGKDVNNTYITGYPNTLYAMKLNSRGKEVFNTYIFGGTGHGPGKSWFDGRSKAKIAFNGNELGIYFEVQKNWADPGQADDIHNGDMFVVLDQNGKMKKDREHFWTASHSSTIQVAAGADGQFYTMTIGDAYPYGLQFYNRNTDKSWLLWPPKEDYIPYEEVNSTNAAGILECMIADNNDFIALMGTLEHPNIGVFDKVDVMFLKTNPKGEVIKQKWLIQSEGVDESVISTSPYGNNHVIAWGMGNDYDQDWEPQNITLSMIDSNGDFIIPPKEFSHPLGTYSKLSSMKNGEIIWTTADNGSRSFTIYRAVIE